MNNQEAVRYRRVPRLTPPPVADTVEEAALWAGDIVVSRKQIRMTTVLGSCVSVCLHDSHLRFGGMNHFLLPTRGETGRHGGWSVRELHRRMLNLGSRPHNLQAKVFGGGSPLALVNEIYAVGLDNARVALDTLNELRVPVVCENVGGNTGMRLYFDNWSGLVLVRLHRENHES